jgi:exodeoxyribonuclease VII large subunit
MQDFGPLFRDPEPTHATEQRTLGVLALNQAIDEALKRGFPGEVWVRGEIQGLARTKMRPHWYFELIEKDPASDQVLAKVSVALLKWNRGAVERELEAMPGFELEDDLEVRVRCEVGYYAPFGKLQLVMKGIDPAFTLGQMAVNRERILRQLASDGLLERNAQCELPVVPQRIGLVTSVGSAAYNDFVHEIERSELGLSIAACDARVQGAQTEDTVIAALRTLQREGCDLLVLIRGGGSRSDLAGFDSETIARAIATASVPVWTGIGHEIDHSVADVVAHGSFKTPTAVAAAIVARGREFLERVEGDWAEIESLAGRRIATESDRLSAVSRQLARETSHAHARATAQLQRRSREVVHSVRVRLVQADGSLRARAGSLAPARFVQALARREAELGHRRRRLAQVAARSLQLPMQKLEAAQLRVRASDPERLLRRGYSLSYDSGGRLLRDSTSLGPGDSMRTRLAGAEVLSRVESTQERGAPPSREEERA